MSRELTADEEKVLRACAGKYTPNMPLGGNFYNALYALRALGYVKRDPDYSDYPIYIVTKEGKDFLKAIDTLNTL